MLTGSLIIQHNLTKQDLYTLLESISRLGVSSDGSSMAWIAPKWWYYLLSTVKKDYDMVTQTGVTFEMAIRHENNEYLLDIWTEEDFVLVDGTVITERQYNNLKRIGIEEV